MAAPATRKATGSRGAAPRGAKKGRAGPPKVAGAIVFDVDKYGGKCVATRRGRVVASAHDFAAIRRAVRELGVEEDAILTHLSETGEFAY